MSKDNGLTEGRADTSEDDALKNSEDAIALDETAEGDVELASARTNKQSQNRGAGTTLTKVSFDNSDETGSHETLVRSFMGDDDLVSREIHGDQTERYQSLNRQTFAGRFQIIRPLGQGGMGAVYLAKDQVLRRAVAIKTLRTTHLDEAQRHRWLQTFRREAGTTAQLQHPHILHVHDFGVDEGVPFMVLEYLRGRTLETLLSQGPLSSERIIHFVRQLLEALGHAHDRGVIHRDLKPANIFIQPGDRLTVMDFGVAILNADQRALEERFGRDRESFDADFGKAAHVAGTPLYMAPEQLLGDDQGSYTDLWSLGVVVFEMVSGQLPFSFPLSILKDDPPLEMLDDALPEKLRRVIELCLRKEVYDRADNARALIEIFGGSDEKNVVSSKTVARTTNLTPASDVFIGRQSEQARLHDMIEEGRRIVTLVGPGGSGKTRLASEFALAHKDNFDAFFYCDVSDARTLDGVLMAVGRALDVPLTQNNAIKQLGFAIAGHGRLLLIVDNFEQVVEYASETLGYWHDVAPSAVFIVTSRHLLNLPFEGPLPLEPLPLPERDDPTHVSVQNDAVRLFVARAQQHAKGFKLDHRNIDDVIALVRALDGLPLAIELAAARARVLSASKMLSKMALRFDMLKKNGRGLSRRQATLLGTLEWSWDLLNPWEQAVLAQASVFEGGFTLDAAEAIIDVSHFDDAPFLVHIVESLVSKSLLRSWLPVVDDQSLDEPRFGMLVSIQAFASNKIEHYDDAFVRGLEYRYARYYSTFGETHAIQALSRRGGAALLRKLTIEIDNFVAGGQRAAACREFDWVTYLVAAVFQVCLLRGPYSLGVDVISRLLETEGLPDLYTMRLQSYRGRLAWRVGRAEISVSDLHDALAIVQRLDDPHFEATILGELAILDVVQGRMDQSRAHSKAALELARRSGDRRNEIKFLTNAAVIEKIQGRTDVARERYSESVALARAVGDRRIEGIILSNLANLDKEQGYAKQARERYLQAIAIARQFGDRRNECMYIANLAVLSKSQGHLDDAQQNFRRAITIAGQIGDRRLEGTTLGNLANLYRDQSRLDEARDCYSKALTVALQLGDQRTEAVNTGNLALVDLEQGHLDSAREGFQKAVAIGRQLSDRRTEGINLHNLARVDFKQQQFHRALELATQSEALLRDIDDRFHLARLLLLKTSLLKHLQEHKQAVEALEEAQRIVLAISVDPSSKLLHELNTLLDAPTSE